MGKPTGFLEIERRDRGYDKPAEARLKTWREFVKPLPTTSCAPGGALHGLRHPVLPPGLPGQQS